MPHLWHLSTQGFNAHPASQTQSGPEGVPTRSYSKMLPGFFPDTIAQIPESPAQMEDMLVQVLFFFFYFLSPHKIQLFLPVLLGQKASVCIVGNAEDTY